MAAVAAVAVAVVAVAAAVAVAAVAAVVAVAVAVAAVAVAVVAAVVAAVAAAVAVVHNADFEVDFSAHFVPRKNQPVCRFRRLNCHILNTLNSPAFLLICKRCFLHWVRPVIRHFVACRREIINVCLLLSCKSGCYYNRFRNYGSQNQYFYVCRAWCAEMNAWCVEEAMQLLIYFKPQLSVIHF